MQPHETEIDTMREPFGDIVEIVVPYQFDQNDELPVLL